MAEVFPVPERVSAGSPNLMPGLDAYRRVYAEAVADPDAFFLEQTRARIAYLAEGHPLYRWMTVGEAVRFTRAFYDTWNDTLVEQILDHFGLPQRAKIRPLSAGQPGKEAKKRLLTMAGSAPPLRANLTSLGA